ncbi:MAG: hypothetical protein ACP5NV_00615 [Candidatus Woesearchaeota archaeon]
MGRTISNPNILNNFCTRFCNIVAKYAAYVVVSGFVAISSGRIRGTEDIDIIISRLNFDTFKKMHSELLRKGFIAMQSDNVKTLYEDYLKNNLSLRYTLTDMPLPEMELKFSKDVLDEYQLKTKIKLPLTGLDIWFSSINMNVAFKEHYLKSSKDLADARHLRIVYPEFVNEREISKIIKMIDRYRL